MGLSKALVCLLLQVFALCIPVRAAPKVLPSIHSPNATQFAVHSLPNVTFPLPPNWAGYIPIPGVGNNKLFFWLFQAENHNASENLIFWLNGGPGCSSMTGLTFENGPLQFHARAAVPNANPYSWTKLANVLYVDQPVGTGYSTGDKAPSNIADVTNDFFHWLKAFYEHFPTLKNKDTYIIGESYAGVYIPYFTKAILSNRNLLDINLKAIALGDPTIGNNAAMTDVVTSTYLHQIASLYKIPTNILHAFDSADHECGFDRVLSQLTYPPIGPITIPGNPEGLNFLKHFHKRKQEKREDTCFPTLPNTPSLINASINDPCTIACATYTTAFAYLDSIKKCFDPYNTHATCNDTKDTSSSTHYFNREDVKRAVHVPLEKDYMECNNTVFERLSQEYVVPPAYGILPEILEKGFPVHIYSGDRDFLLNHWGTELVVGNMS
ncbi:MAG: hypothetical protein Q9188_007371, partial [Gyalolechia gomerana]